MLFKPKPGPQPESTAAVASSGETITTPSPPHTQRRSPYLLAHWRGEQSLAQSYWINGFLLTGLFIGGSTLLEEPVSSLSVQNAVFASMAFTAIVALVTIWQLVGIWRSATNAKRKTARSFWPNVAKVLVILSVIGGTTTAISMGRDFVNLLVALQDPELAEFRIDRWGETDLIFEGAINDSSVDEIINALSDPWITILRVNSRGGLTNPAIRLAHHIRENEIFVVAEGQCESACIWLLAASPYGAIVPGTKVALHATEPVVEFQTQELREELSAHLQESFKNYREFDVAEWAIERTKVEKFWTPTIDEKIRMGLIVKIYDLETEEFVEALEYCAEHEAQCRQ